MKLKKKTKTLIIISIIIVILLIFCRLIYLRIQELNKKYTNINDFKTAKQVTEYMDCKYIAKNKSDSENFAFDIYVVFKENLYTNGKSNEEFFKQFLRMMAHALEYDNFRVIDDEKELLIAVVCDGYNREITKIYFNGDDNYFGHEESKNKIKNQSEISIIKMNIQSPEILSLINNKWIASKVNFGKKESTFDKYDIYFDEGIETRTIDKKIFNIIFNKRYEKEILSGITTKNSLTEIENKLGKPTFGDVESGLIGYKGEEIYIFFSNEETSVYRMEREYDTDKIVELLANFRENKNVKKFVNGLTDIWLDYDKYEYDSDFVNLEYALKGIKIQFNITNNHGLIIYNNYIGKFDENITKESIMQGNGNAPEYLFFEDIDLVYENEMERYENKKIYYEEDGDIEYTEENLNSNNKIALKYTRTDEGIKNIGFIFKEKDYPNSEILKNQNITSYLWLDDYQFIYGIKEKGIFIYNAQTRTTKTVIEGNEKYSLKKIENNILFYDEKNINL